jgi:carbonic anhydrase
MADAGDRGATGGEYARLLAENQRYTEAFDRSALTALPLSRLAVLTCMDGRLDIEEALGLRTGDAHVLRNAGGIVTEDVLRSLLISQHLVGTREVVVIEHTGCALVGVNETALRAQIATAAGTTADAVQIGFGSFDDVEANVRRQVDILRTHPWLRDVPVHGLVFDVRTGRLHEVA